MLELAETIEDGLRREVREQTGLQIGHAALADVYKNMTRGIIALVFRCELAAGLWQLSPNDEADAFRWADQSEVTLLADEAYAVCVLDAMASRLAPDGRAHDGVRLLVPDATQ